jgi:hypothetical protein
MIRKVSWRAKIREGAISLLALVTLLSILYVADLRVREGATHVASVASGVRATQIGAQMSSDASKLVSVARGQSAENAAMTAFVAVAGILLLFMLKT